MYLCTNLIERFGKRVDVGQEVAIRSATVSSGQGRTMVGERVVSHWLVASNDWRLSITCCKYSISRLSWWSVSSNTSLYLKNLQQIQGVVPFVRLDHNLPLAAVPNDARDNPPDIVSNLSKISFPAPIHTSIKICRSYFGPLSSRFLTMFLIKSCTGRSSATHWHS